MFPEANKEWIISRIKKCRVFPIEPLYVCLSPFPLPLAYVGHLVSKTHRRRRTQRKCVVRKSVVVDNIGVGNATADAQTYARRGQRVPDRTFCNF